MTVVSSAISNLVNGVSQQPDIIRLPSQCSVADNCYPTIVKGNSKRPPFVHLNKIHADLSTPYDAFVHFINRDESERYCVVVTDGNLLVTDLLGNPITVTFPYGASYLAGSNPQRYIRAITVADYTFIVNTLTVAQMTSDKSPTYTPQALLYVRQGGYGITYTVTIVSGGNTYSTSFQTPNGGTATDSTQIDNRYILNQLSNQLQAIAGFNAAFTIDVQGSVALVKATGTTDFTISTKDGLANNGLFGIKDQIQHFEDLPKQAIDGFWVKVAGDPTNNFDDYYVVYSDPNHSSTSGIWKETTAQNITTTIDGNSMPHQLVRQDDGTFIFQPVNWGLRTVGDNKSAAVPSFIGQRINDVFFHRDRLGFLAGQNVIMSKVGDFFNFWPDTATDLLDSDRIDVAANHTKVSILRCVAPYNDDLILFSDLTQFKLAGGDLLTPKTITIKPQTEFENSTFRARAVSIGKVVYFPVDRGVYTGLREYQVAPFTGIIDAPEVTSHVPAYVPSRVFKIAATNTEQAMALLTDTDQSSIYIYKYAWKDSQKVQSAWCRWVLAPSDQVVGCAFIGTVLYAVINRPDKGLFLEQADIQTAALHQPFRYQVNLDRLVLLQGTYNATTGLTTWTLPYSESAPMQVVMALGFATPGKVVPASPSSATTLVAVGDYSAGSCYVGRTYSQVFQFSQQYPRENRDGAAQAIDEGRLQLNRFSVAYDLTGYFRAQVTPYARGMQSYVFTSYELADQATVLGALPVGKGTFKFPVLSDARTVTIELVNDSFLPSSFQTAGWEGKYYIRSQRIS